MRFKSQIFKQNIYLNQISKLNYLSQNQTQHLSYLNQISLFKSEAKNET